MLFPLILLAQSPFTALDAYAASVESTSLIVVKDGVRVHESYPNGGSVSAKQSLASGSKSFWGVLAVRLQQAGKLSLSDPVSKVLTEWKGDPKREKITVDELLHLVGGYTQRERMNFDEAAKVVPSVDAGTLYHYGPMPFQIFGAYLRRLTGKEPTNLLKETLLDPLKISAEWNGLGRLRDPLLPGGGRMTASDWATFGEMVRKDAPLRAILGQGSKANAAYGLTWWMPVPTASRDLVTVRSITPMSTQALLPKDTIIAAGAGYQRLFVIPSWGVVAVRTGPITQNPYEDVPFIRHLATALGR